MRCLWLGVLASCTMLFAAEEMEIAGTVVNVRKEPSPKAAVVGKLKAGERVRVKAVKDGWAELEGKPGFISAALLRKPASAAAQEEKKTTVKPAAPASAKKTDKDNPFPDIPVIPGSAREVTDAGMLYHPKEAKGPLAYVLLKEVNGKYQVRCYVYSSPQDEKIFKQFANKEKKVQLIGTWYRVENWKNPVMKVRKIKEL